jgi:hypothetical protein
MGQSPSENWQKKLGSACQGRFVAIAYDKSLARNQPSMPVIPISFPDTGI